MNRLDQARALYRGIGEDFDRTLALYLAQHFVYSSPTCLVLAKPEGDTWWIEYLGGSVEEALTHLPHWLPKIEFARRGRRRVYWTATLVARLCSIHYVTPASRQVFSLPPSE